MLVQYKVDIIISSSSSHQNVTCSHHDIADNCSLALNSLIITHSLTTVSFVILIKDHYFDTLCIDIAEQ
jgi:hypothetical protein